MLTTEVKQRINTCRDILVGKLPDPKSQVIQITNALIYKFMDDQDRLSEKLGGKPSFFVKELKPYAWHKLFDSKLTNQERADLYVEGIEKLSVAKHLPELFQDIFKEAYVPFKAAGTLTLFIEEINKFDYTHSEELGNAYEYLLSIMGSQGDAGQFRTPRHIIEFMVDVIDPQKTETVFDPACGTAGFLISAFKHIAEANSDKLTATEKKKLAENIIGVDISPDMAKMARVNLYLHGFTSPEIKEGDTLTDEPLWGTKYDVILANPPFMSPKGGIIPHDKFAIKAKRAEVLFTDYIAEHLKLKGRAAIIVPEGVIFQSGTTYKALRKMLVEDGYLHSVISLPAGVFQPYSGVKTSILILDRERAKESSEVLFMKIENDGYTLSSQRTEKAGSQLPEALAVAKAWRVGEKQETSFASWVTKKEIAESGDYNLTGERYRVFESTSSTYDFVEIGDVISTVTPPGKLAKKDYQEVGLYPIIDQSADEIAGYSNTSEYLVNHPKPLVIFGDHTCVAKLVEQPFIQGADGIKIIEPKENLLSEFLYFLLKYKPLESDGYQRHFTKLKRYKIPLPPIEVQREIVAELDRYQKIIDGARQVVENYKPSFKIDPEWQFCDLDSLVDITTGKLNANAASDNGKYPFFTCAKEAYKIDKYSFDCEALLLAGNNASADYDVKYYKGKFDAYQRTYVITIKDEKKVLYQFLKVSLEDKLPELKNKSIGNLTKYLTLGVIKELQIAIPPIKVQKILVDLVEKEKLSVEQCADFVNSFEQKIKDKITEVWGE
jgi:type I restriction enzyme M protein